MTPTPSIEKKSTAKLQDARTVRKIVNVDDHICLAFAGLTADARVLINKARVHCQSTRLSLDQPASVEGLTKYLAGIQQKFTQSSGVRPFGISTLIVGYATNGEPRLFQTEPSGTYSSWKASAIGRNSKTVREFLEKHYTETSGQDTVKLALKALLETVEPGSKTIELAVMEKDTGLRVLTDEQVDALVKEIEEEKAAAEAARRGGAQARQT
ncbi:unnamed protein product [Ostreobium quekettii]|uniref:Uncharacterized protein n=1 Tax=Ostreobium quekettii TaxID=121088 RepID=A0A8S1IU72_9CHLO|nr:unnamed protein product [Ostreobium quekettii]